MGEILNWKSNCRIVLVQPKFAGNIGMTARAMANFGFSNLYLVDPLANQHDIQATMMAREATHILRDAKVVATLQEAIATTHYVIGTSGKISRNEADQPSPTPKWVVGHLESQFPAGCGLAILFGSETDGLTKDHLQYCQQRMLIPTVAEHPSMNLGQAVGVCLYELSQIRWHSLPTLAPNQQNSATIADIERLVQVFEKSLRRTASKWDGHHVQNIIALRQLLAKASLQKKELQALYQIARTLERLVEPDSAADSPK